MGHGAAATMALSFYLPVQAFASEAGAEGDCFLGMTPAETDLMHAPTEHAHSRRKTHRPDGKCTAPTENAPSRRKMHHPDGKCTIATENAPSPESTYKSTRLTYKLT